MTHECGTQPDWDLSAMATQDAESGRESPKRKADTDADVPTTKQRTEEPPLGHLFNLMPHDFHLFDDDGNLVYKLTKEEFVLRTENARAPARCPLTFGGLTVLSDEDVPQLVRAEDVERLAQYKGRTIVTSRVAAEVLAQRVRDRFDPIGVYVITPNSAPDSVVRDEDGAIRGVKRVLRWGWC